MPVNNKLEARIEKKIVKVRHALDDDFPFRAATVLEEAIAILDKARVRRTDKIYGQLLRMRVDVYVPLVDVKIKLASGQLELNNPLDAHNLLDQALAYMSKMPKKYLGKDADAIMFSSIRELRDAAYKMEDSMLGYQSVDDAIE